MNSQPFQAYQILITGANSELGAAIARYFLEQDPRALLILAIHTNKDKAAELASLYPKRCRLQKLDVTDACAWQNLSTELEAASTPLRVLVNNAGIHDDSLLAHMTDRQWSRVLDTNLHSVFYACRKLLKPLMMATHGRIINISSLSALLSPPGQTNYAASKAALLGFTQSLAKEVARSGLTVNSLSPGYIATEALAGWSKEQTMAAKARIPMRRFATPREVASTVYYLSTPDAGYITGANIKIDGGTL